MTVRLTKPQERIVEYLYRSGWASPRAIAFALYNDRRKVPYGLIERLRDRGLVTSKFNSALTLTSEGRGIGRALAERKGL